MQTIMLLCKYKVSGVSLCYNAVEFFCRTNLFLRSDLYTLCLDSDVRRVFVTNSRRDAAFYAQT